MNTASLTGKGYKRLVSIAAKLSSTTNWNCYTNLGYYDDILEGPMFDLECHQMSD